LIFSSEFEFERLDRDLLSSRRKGHIVGEGEDKLSVTEIVASGKVFGVRQNFNLTKSDKQVIDFWVQLRG